MHFPTRLSFLTRQGNLRSWATIPHPSFTAVTSGQLPELLCCIHYRRLLPAELWAYQFPTWREPDAHGGWKERTTRVLTVKHHPYQTSPAAGPVRPDTHSAATPATFEREDWMPQMMAALLLGTETRPHPEPRCGIRTALLHPDSNRAGGISPATAVPYT